jgi:hypothetical protein
MASAQMSNLKIFVGNAEITRHVHEVKVEARVGDLMTTTIVIRTPPRIEQDGRITSIRFDDGVGPLVVGRGIRLRERP